MIQFNFERAISLLKSSESLEYEDGYQWLQGENLRQNIDPIVDLLLDEVIPTIRSRFVELVGNADLESHIGVLEAELSNPDADVRMWAFAGLAHSEHESALEIAAAFQRANPDEEYL